MLTLMLTLTGYLGFGVDLGNASLQQEVDHLDVAIVTGHMQRSVTQLGAEQQQMNHRLMTFWSCKYIGCFMYMYIIYSQIN